MGKGKSGLSVYSSDSPDGMSDISKGFKVYKNYNEKYLFYRNSRRRKRDIKAVGGVFPGISQILKTVQMMEKECAYCRLENNSNIDQSQSILLYLLKIATKIIAAEQAHNRELQYRVDVCTLFLDENFQLVRLIKKLYEKMIMLDNQLLDYMDANDAIYAETVLTQRSDVSVYDIFLQDVSPGWDSINWGQLEIGEFNLEHSNLSKDSDSLVESDRQEFIHNNGVDYDNIQFFSNTPVNNDCIPSNSDEFVSPYLDLDFRSSDAPINPFVSSEDNLNNNLQNLTPMSFTFEDSLLGIENDGQNIGSDNSYKSAESPDRYDDSEAIVETLSPGQTNSNETSADSSTSFKDEISSFKRFFISRVQTYNFHTETNRLLNAENAYLYNLITKLQSGGEIDLSHVSDYIKLKEKLDMHKEHWERLEEILSSYCQTTTDESDLTLPEHYQFTGNVIDEDIKRYLFVFASISTLLSQVSFEGVLAKSLKNKDSLDILLSSLEKISDVDDKEFYINDLKRELSMQRDISNRLSLITTANYTDASDSISQLNSKIYELNEKLLVLEKDRKETLGDCKKAADLITDMENEINIKKLKIEDLLKKIDNLESQIGKNGVRATETRRTFDANSMEGVMKRALGNCIRELEFEESNTLCTTMVSSDSDSEMLFESDTDDSDVSISRIQNHPILPNLLAMLERLNSGYISLVRALKERNCLVNRIDMSKYISMMDGLASLIRGYNKSPKYDHELNTIQMIFRGETVLNSSDILYLLKVIAKLAELAQTILLERDVDINRGMSRTTSKLERAKEQIKRLEEERTRIISEKNDLKSNINGLRKEMESIKYPIDRLQDRYIRTDF